MTHPTGAIDRLYARPCGRDTVIVILRGGNRTCHEGESDTGQVRMVMQGCATG